MRQSKVLIIFSSSDLGGAERSLTRMALTSGGGIEYKLATLNGEGPWCDWVRLHGCEPLVLGRDRIGGLMLGVFWRLICYVRSNPVDSIYVCGARASFLLRILRVFMPRIKLVHAVRWNPDSDSSLDRFFRLMERFTYFMVDAWITNSYVAKKTLISRCKIPEERIFVIHNGIESAPTNVVPLNERPMEVLTVANLHPRKGHKEYLKIILDVLKSVPNVNFVFIGRDEMNGEIQRAVEEIGLVDKVSYEGFQADVSPWLRRARLMVLPSLWGEGCPTSILEGFAYGLPTVAYAIDGIPELIENGVDGVIVSPSMSDSLANAIIDVITNPLVAESMGRMGSEKVARRFTLESCADKHAQTFCKFILIK